MIVRNDILISVVFVLTILILVWVIVFYLARKLGSVCGNTDEETKDDLHRERIYMDEARIDYSWETVQPELKRLKGNLTSRHNKFEKRKMKVLDRHVLDSADEMSLIYDTKIIETEADEQRKLKATVARFSKYLDNVPGDEPVILVSLHYVKDEENMVLAIIKVANLKPFSNNKIPDTYVRVDVWKGKQIKLKKKTFVMKKELNPVYNQKMEFHISTRDLYNTKIVLTIATFVFSQDADFRERAVPLPLYILEFGEKSTGSCLEHWKTAITNDKPVAKWHTFN